MIFMINGIGEILLSELRFWRIDAWPNEIGRNEPHPIFLIIFQFL